MSVSPATPPEASGPAARSLDTITAWPAYSPGPGPVSDRESWARVIGQALCADGSLDPDQWFPVSAEAGNARREAAAAIAICQVCPVRGQCLALSLRHWDVGQNGIWGGLVAAERARLRRRMLAHRAGALRYFTDASGLEVHLHRPQPVS
jgi:hypothetical protein